MLKIASIIICGVIGISVLSLSSCDTAKDVVARVADDTSAAMSDEGDTPRVAKEEQRRERKRQNNTWTKENQAEHPIEYCQYQLRNIKSTISTANGRLLAVKTQLSGFNRKHREAEEAVKKAEHFLNTLKPKYKEAKKTKKWPIVINGYQLNEEQATENMRKALAKVKTLRTNCTKLQLQCANLDKEKMRATKDKELALSMQEKLENTISSLKVKQLKDGANNVRDTLNALNDQLNGLDDGNDESAEPSIDNLMESGSESTVSDADLDAFLND